MKDELTKAAEGLSAVMEKVLRMPGFPELISQGYTVAEIAAAAAQQIDGANVAGVKARTAEIADTFGPNLTSFLWFPYLPIGEYTVMMADGGTGKTILCCGIAAAVSSGKPLPGQDDTREGKNVLIISAEDSGELLRERLELSGADLSRVRIIDCSASIGLNFSAGYAEFEATLKEYNPALVIIDPWHAFLGVGVDINRVNAVRPVFQKLSHLAKICDCALILVSHVNKRAQGENANNAATGSADFVNASRSALRVVFDEADENCRVAIHTKSNYAKAGRSVRYRIEGGGLVWDGYSEITRETLEAAARRKTTPMELLRGKKAGVEANEMLVRALEEAAQDCRATRFTYEEFKERYGSMVFGAGQPKRALDAVSEKLLEDGFFLKSGIQVVRGKQKDREFLIQRVEGAEQE